MARFFKLDKFKIIITLRRTLKFEDTGRKKNSIFRSTVYQRLFFAKHFFYHVLKWEH